MIEPEHHCWWTRQHRSQLSLNGEYLSAAGVPRAVIDTIASRLGHALTEEPNPSDEYGTLLTLGPWRVAMHDECFLRLASSDVSLRAAFLDAVVELHDCYLGSSIGPAGVALVQKHLRDGVTVELRSDLRRSEFQVKSYPIGARWWFRRGTPIERACAGSARTAGL